MPKIRGVKPETWTDDKFVQLSPLARLLYIGMWNYACDNGHLEDNVVQLKIRLLPVDNCDVSKLLEEMEKTGQITRKDGWIKVVKLPEHQSPDKRFITTCEGCLDDPDTTYEPLKRPHHTTSTRSAHTENTSRTPSAHADDGDGDGDGDGELSGRAATTRRATRLPDDWQPNDAHRALAAERRVAVDFELSKFRDWAASNGTVKKDWDATFRNWIRNSKPTVAAAPAHDPSKPWRDVQWSK